MTLFYQSKANSAIPACSDLSETTLDDNLNEITWHVEPPERQKSLRAGEPPHFTWLFS